MAAVSDADIEKMISKLKDEFGTADSEAVTENSYAFKGKMEEMRKTLSYIDSLKQERDRGRLCVKSLYGFDI